jgi:hypothetical protein
MHAATKKNTNFALQVKALESEGQTVIHHASCASLIRLPYPLLLVKNHKIPSVLDI